MDRNTVVQRRREPIFTRLDDELLALDPKVGRCYALSGTGTRIWELIDSPIAIASVCDRVVAEFEVDQDTCLADVLELMGELDAAGLIELQGAAA